MKCLKKRNPRKQDHDQISREKTRYSYDPYQENQSRDKKIIKGLNLEEPAKEEQRHANLDMKQPHRQKDKERVISSGATKATIKFKLVDHDENNNARFNSGSFGKGLCSLVADTFTGQKHFFYPLASFPSLNLLHMEGKELGASWLSSLTTSFTYFIDKNRHLKPP
ncbi:hypothetical protein YC2023_091110 [Brassica napus]